MPKVSSGLTRNVRLLYIVTFLENSFYIDAIYVLFGRQYLHLDYFRAGSLVFIGWFASIAFDFLGGVIADTVGRKRAQLYGLALQIVGFLPFIVTKNYGVLALGSFVYGLGMALSSNTLQALVYEQAREQGDTKLYQRFNAMAQVYTFVGLSTAALIGGLAYALDPRLPYFLMMVGLAAAFVACMRITVSQRVEREVTEKEHHKTIVRTAWGTIRGHTQLLYFVLIGFLLGLAGDLLFSYYQPFYLNYGVAAATFGIMYAVFRIISCIGSYAMQHLPNKFSLPMVQLASIASVGITVVLMLVLPFPAVVAAPVVVAVGFGFNYPALRLFINTHASDMARAATLSFGTGVMNLGVGVGFIGTFWMADHFSTHTILHVIVAVTAVAFLLRLATLEKVLRVILPASGHPQPSALPVQHD